VRKAAHCEYPEMEREWRELWELVPGWFATV
jgi:hypothetical protein